MSRIEPTAVNHPQSNENTEPPLIRTWPKGIFLLTVVGLSLLLMIDALMDAFRDNAIENEHHRYIANVILEAGRPAVAAAMAENDVAEVNRLLDHLATIPELRYVSARNSVGAAVAERGSRPVDDDSHIELSKLLKWNIAGEEIEVGELLIIMESITTRHFLNAMIGRKILLLLLVIAASLYGIASAHHRVCTRLRELCNAALRRAMGHEEQKIPYQHLPDEVGDIARAVEKLCLNSRSLYDLQERLVHNMTLKSQEVINVRQSVNQLSRTSNLFLASVSQEIRAPLTAIRGAVSLCKNGMAGSVQEQTLGLLHIAEENCRRLESLVQEVMDIYELQSGTLVVEQREVELSSLIQREISRWEPQAKKKHQRISFDTFATSPNVLADSLRLEQVLDIVINNAVRYSGANAEIQISLDTSGEMVRIIIADNGPGIPLKLRPYLFDILGEEKEAQCRMHGRGIGLGLAKGIVSVMHGEFSYESMSQDYLKDSTLESGTTFFIDLPMFEAGIKPAVG